MGENINKALMFGVGLFVTVMIISGLMTIFSQMQDVYKNVGGMDTSITNRFGSYASYDNTTLTGLEVINCANKFYNDNLVVVVYDTVEVNNKDGIEFLDKEYEDGNLKYEDKYLSTLEEIEVDGIPKKQISFSKVL